jgi:hypothetical protein
LQSSTKLEFEKELFGAESESMTRSLEPKTARIGGVFRDTAFPFRREDSFSQLQRCWSVGELYLRDDLKLLFADSLTFYSCEPRPNSRNWKKEHSVHEQENVYQAQLCCDGESCYRAAAGMGGRRQTEKLGR